jgi:tRNA threonylcarbamoyladenosine modification (KEOPS) complex Cgi121 subunit
MQQKPVAVNQNLDTQALLEIIMRNIPATRQISEAYDLTARNEGRRKAA